MRERDIYINHWVIGINMDKPAYDKPLVSLDVDMWIYHVLAKKNGTCEFQHCQKRGSPPLIGVP